MSILFNAIPQQITISSIHCTLEMPSLSLRVRRSAMLLRSTDKGTVTLGFLIFPAGVKTWTLVKSHSPYSCSKVVLNGFYTTTFSTCNCEVIPPGMTTKSVFMDLTVIVTLISGVTCPLNVPKTVIPWPSVPHHQQPILPSNLYVGIWQQVLYTVSWFRITCGGNLLPSANTSNIKFTK
jgi:hypothetical protein